MDEIERLGDGKGPVEFDIVDLEADVGWDPGVGEGVSNKGIKQGHGCVGMGVAAGEWRRTSWVGCS